MGEDHLSLGIDRRLGVVTLDEAVAALHDPALRIGEVALRLVGRGARLRLGLAPAPIALRHRRLRLGLRLGLGFQRRLGGADLLQPLGLVRHPGRHLVAALVAQRAILLGIRRLGRRQPGGDFGRQFRLGLLHSPVAHRLMLGRVGLHFGPIQGNMTQVHQSGLLAQPQHLDEQLRQGPQMPPAELRNRPEIRLVAGRHRQEVQPLLARPRQPTGRVDPSAVAVEQHRRHHPRIERRVAAKFGVTGQDRRQIQLLSHQVPDKMGDMIRRNELIDRWRQKLRLVNQPRAKSLAHDPSESRTYVSRHGYVDRLLAI